MSNEIQSSDGPTDEALAGQADKRGSLRSHGDRGRRAPLNSASSQMGSERSSPSEAIPVAWGRVINGKAVTVSREWTPANDEPLYATPPAPDRAAVVEECIAAAQPILAGFNEHSVQASAIRLALDAHPRPRPKDRGRRVTDLTTAQIQLLRKLADGHYIAYSRDGDHGWVSGTNAILDDKDIWALRNRHYIEQSQTSEKMITAAIK